MNEMKSSDRGAVLVYVIVAAIGLVAVSALTIDAGVKWMARNQAQNAADAGALAGATALSFDDADDRSDNGPAKQAALHYALANMVWGESPDVDVTTDITFPPCPDGSTDTCIKVDVFRNQARGNFLPTFAAALVGVTSQGVRATATAQVRTGNSTDCLKPWAVVDRWDECPGDPGNCPAGTPYDYPASDGDWNRNSTYDRWLVEHGNVQPEGDYYVPPTATSPGTGWTVDRDFGEQFGLKTDSPGNTTVSSGWFRSIDLPRRDEANLGGDTYGDNIVSCNGYATAIADPDTICPDPSAIASFEDKVYWAARGCVRVQTGIIQGQTVAGIEEIFNRDPTAHWNPSLNAGRGGVDSPLAPSPRIVPVAVMDIDSFLQRDPSGSTGVAKLVNIFGFFIEGLGDIGPAGEIIFDSSDPMNPRNKVVIGRLVTIPGLTSGRSVISEEASFLNTILLVR